MHLAKTMFIGAAPVWASTLGLAMIVFSSLTASTSLAQSPIIHAVEPPQLNRLQIAIRPNVESSKPSSAFDGVQDDAVLREAPALPKSQVDDQEQYGLPQLDIRDIRLDPRDSAAKIPDDQSLATINRYHRDWTRFESLDKLYAWTPANIRYQPLYFEDVALERYGQSRGEIRQTVLSAAHFFSSTALLPLHMWHDPIYSCDYPLGYYRPGNPAPRIFQTQFWSLNRR